MSYTEHAEDIVETLSEHDIDADQDDVEESLATLIEEYSVPETEAKNSILRNLGGDEFDESPSVSGGGEMTDVAAIDSPDNWYTVEVKVLQLWDPNHESIKQTGLVGDETGRIKFTSWADSDNPTLAEDSVYRFESVVSDEYEGRMSIQLNSSTEVTELDTDIEADESSASFTGALVDVQSGSGLIKRCEAEDCTRMLKNNRCSEHGSMDGEHDMRIKAVLDDGESVQEVLFDAEATEDLTGIGLDEAKEMAKEALDPTVVADEIRDRISGRYYEVEGGVAGRYILVNECTELTGIDSEKVDELLARAEEA